MLTVFTLEKTEQWDLIVRSFKEYDVYWLSGYVKAFQIHGDGEPLLFFYDDAHTRGINVVMKRDVAKDVHFKEVIPEHTYYDFCTPYGYGGWLIEGDNTDNLFSTYEDWLEKNGIICEFVRFHPLVKNHLKCSAFYEVTQLGEVVHMDLSSPEVIWNNIISKNRNMIRKAIKNGIKIYNGRFPEIFDKFISIYNLTMLNDNAKEYYLFQKPFYDSILNDLPQNAQIFWAEKDDKIIAASIMLQANGRMNYHLSGSLREYNSFAPGNLLLFQAALWGNSNGCQTLYLGGGVGSGEDGLLRYKRSFFRGDLNHFSIGTAIYCHKKYEYLLKIRSGIETSSFFPKYRG